MKVRRIDTIIGAFALAASVAIGFQIAPAAAQVSPNPLSLNPEYDGGAEIQLTVPYFEDGDSDDNHIVRCTGRTEVFMPGGGDWSKPSDRSRPFTSGRGTLKLWGDPTRGVDIRPEFTCDSQGAHGRIDFSEGSWRHWEFKNGALESNTTFTVQFWGSDDELHEVKQVETVARFDGHRITFDNRPGPSYYLHDMSVVLDVPGRLR